MALYTHTSLRQRLRKWRRRLGACSLRELIQQQSFHIPKRLESPREVRHRKRTFCLDNVQNIFRDSIHVKGKFVRPTYTFILWQSKPKNTLDGNCRVVTLPLNGVASLYIFGFGHRQTRIRRISFKKANPHFKCVRGSGALSSGLQQARKLRRLAS